MAGIGLQLQSLSEMDTFTSRLKAYVYAGFITAGPWLSMVFSISAIQLLLQAYSPIAYSQKELFLLSVSYCFIFSLILHGGVQLVITRYLSDLLYENKGKEAFAAFLGISKLVSVIALIIGVVFCLFSPLTVLYKAVLISLFLTVNLIWILIVFLTASKYYIAISCAFLAGTAVAVGLAFLFTSLGLFQVGEHSQALNQLVGFSIGMVVTLMLLFYSLLSTFPDRSIDGQFAFMDYFDKYPSLIWTGLLYNMGIWVCNWIIWFGDGATTIAGTFRFHTANDSAMFWAYLTIIPTLASFLLSIETRFYPRYKQFYGYVNNGGTLDQVQVAKKSLLDVLKQEMERMFRNQAFVSMFFIITPAFFTSFMNVNSVFVSLFRFTVLGAFSNAMLLVLMQVMLYFDDRKGALRSVLVFFSCNTGLTLAFLPLGFRGYGLGFALGSTIAFMYACMQLINYLSEVDYHVYCRPEIETSETGRFHKWGAWLETHTVIEKKIAAAIPVRNTEVGG
jgi:uncharacterized membrane protein